MISKSTAKALNYSEEEKQVRIFDFPKQEKNRGIFTDSTSGTDAIVNTTNIEGAFPDFTRVQGVTYHKSDDYWREANPVQKKALYDESIFIPIQPDVRESLDKAFERITDATDSDVSLAERSNCFDEWKDLMKHIVRIGEDLSGNHRKILGALISSTKNKDMADFSGESIKIFIQDTNLLRRPRVTKPEAKEAMKSLISKNIDPMIPLSLDDASEELLIELDQFMDRLLEEDKKRHGKI